MPPTIERESILSELGDLRDYQVAEGNADVRRWEVFGADDQRIGEVRELIVDTHAMKARYLVVTLERGLPNVSERRDALVPLARARLDERLERVYVEDVNTSTASTLPVYERGTLTPERERALFSARPAEARPNAAVHPGGTGAELRPGGSGAEMRPGGSGAEARSPTAVVTETVVTRTTRVIVEPKKEEEPV
ncbi:MAG: PRC-barrel domain-containing protein [Myxococcota bacterium]